MKRNFSDMESDCDDVFAEDSPKGSLTTDSDSCQVVNRKRRRGIIEKRRRDRINNSLSELRRLVPAAFEKQGSAKLEKAEILQMTVDHLRGGHLKGVDIFSFDSHKFIMDYHGIGFRECASEVARYLVGMEGMDLQDPLRMRLMSHLQCYAAQRELAIKSATTPNPWSPTAVFGSVPAAAAPPAFPPVGPPPSLSEGGGGGGGGPPSLPGTPPYNCTEGRLGPGVATGDCNLPSGVHVPSPGSRGSTSAAAAIPPTSLPPIGTTAADSNTTMAHTLTQMAGNRYLGGHGYSGYSPGTPAQPSPVRPYRPWGAELAY